MAITTDTKNLTEEFGKSFEEGNDSYDFGCGMINKGHTVYVGEREAFEEDDEIGFDTSLLSENPEKVVYEDGAKMKLYKCVPENGSASYFEDTLFEKVMDLFDMESPNDYFEFIHLHERGEWPVVIECPDEPGTIALIAPRILPE